MSWFLFLFQMMLNHYSRQDVCKISMSFKIHIPFKICQYPSSFLWYQLCQVEWLKFPRRKVETSLLLVHHHHISVTQNVLVSKNFTEHRVTENMAFG